MRTGPVSTPNERGPVARGQGKELEGNMGGGWGSHRAGAGGTKVTEAGICLRCHCHRARS